MNQVTFIDPDSTVPIPAGGSPTTNVGNGTMSTPIPSSATLTEDFTITCTVPGGANVGQFSVTGSVSGLLGTATSDEEFVDADQKVRFTLTAGGTPWAVSDEFTFSTVAGTPMNEGNFDDFATEIANWGHEPNGRRVEKFSDLFVVSTSAMDNFGYSLNQGSGTFNVVDRVVGVLEISTPGGGSGLIYLWNTSTGTVQFTLGAEESRFACYCNTAEAGTTEKIVIIGWGDTNVRALTTTDNQKGVFFRVEAAGSGVNISCVTKNGTSGAGNETVTDSGIADSSTFHLFEIKATSSEVRFYIDGVLVATHTTNIPTTGISPRIGVAETEAAVKTMRIDWIKESIATVRPT